MKLKRIYSGKTLTGVLELTINNEQVEFFLNFFKSKNEQVDLVTLNRV